MKLEQGMTIQTSYNSGPYIIESIGRGCTCMGYLDQINQTQVQSRQPHIHLTLSRVGDSAHCDKFYLNRYDEETLRSIDSEDYLIILDEGIAAGRGFQGDLF